MIKKNAIADLPTTFGVYLFKQGNKIIYIGKSINIRVRVKSHLENAKLDRKEFLIVSNADKIDYVVTDNEFAALILESQLIKKFHPKYNVIWKDGKNYLYIKVTVKDRYPKVLLSRKENDDRSLYFGPFSSVRVTESLVNDIRRIVPFCTEKSLSEKPCFYSKINLCQPCPNFIKKQNKDDERKLRLIYRHNIRRVLKILNGGVTDILTGLYRQLKSLTKSENFEEAIKIRNKIFRLERLINHPTTDLAIVNEQNHKKSDSLHLLTEELSKYFPGIKKLDRIECYDISNLKQSNQVGSMVVMNHGQIDKKEYRRFRIKQVGSRSDFDRLKEVISRRFKNHWTFPDLVVVDGGRPQVKIVIDKLTEIGIKIPVLGIAKNPDRLVLGISDYPTVRFPQTNPAFNLIRLLRDESHRFAKKYHILLRRRPLLV
ncbi:GIY-YIG nuclease family protein [Patescibacteria group bacterium]|nr:GIY-YIG nuclease family protein [Patescibacteria group bacterium]